MRTNRQLLPEVDGVKWPPAVAKAQAALDKAMERQRNTGAELRQAEGAVRSADQEDTKRRRQAVAADKPTPKPVKPDREAALDDAKGRAKDAIQLAKEAEDRLAEEIRKAQPELIAQIDVDGHADRILGLLDQAAQELEQFADQVGAVRTFREIEEPRRRTRGHEPFRTRRDTQRYEKPSVLLDGLRAQVGDLRMRQISFGPSPRRPRNPGVTFRRRGRWPSRSPLTSRGASDALSTTG
jgi:hypothetical protein